MSKMTDEQIKKALECCIESSNFGECFENKCPFVSENGCKVGKETLYPYVLDLINRQQSEIEDYKLYIRQLTKKLTNGNGLRIRVDNMIVYADDLEEWLEFCDGQKEEAIEECLGKIEQMDVSESDDYIMIKKYNFDNFLKEMVGKKDGQNDR